MPNRIVCSALEEMRKMHDTRHYSGLLGFVEEVQTMVNRMESALWDQRDILRYRQEAVDLKKEIKALKAEKNSLSNEKDRPSSVHDILGTDE